MIGADITLSGLFMKVSFAIWRCSVIVSTLCDIVYYRGAFEKSCKFCNYYKTLNRSRCLSNYAVNRIKTIYFQMKEVIWQCIIIRAIIKLDIKTYIYFRYVPILQ